ncbi:ABC transporter substrate-binding protein [Aureimonas frigidaquae]|nr:ABC transporter substrate-binding protein [Aureimonas frigidaquae]
MTVAQAATTYPLTIQNCGRSLTFEAPPASVVSIGQSSTEILYLLGLADKVAATALWFGPVLPAFADADAAIERLSDNDPSFESVVAKRPALVTTQFEWQIGPQGVVGTTAQFEELGIPVYTAPSDCTGKDNSGGGDGVRTEPFTMDQIHQEIRDLAAIFDVTDRGDALVLQLKEREAKARSRVAQVGSDMSAVFWFSSTELRADPFVAGSNGAPGTIMEALGLRNVIVSDEEWPLVGWETIARSDPTFIVAAQMDRRRYPADDAGVKKEFLTKDPVTKLMPAVRDGRILTLDAQTMNPTIRTIDGIEALADAIAASRPAE